MKKSPKDQSTTAGRERAGAHRIAGRDTHAADMSSGTKSVVRGSVSATLGGPGWQPRDRSHAVDVAEGRVWKRCGYRSEVAPLREVMLAWPPDSIAEADPHDAYLFLEHVDLRLLRRQTRAVASFYERHGVHVELVRPKGDTSPNILFQRDLYFITPEGALMARMAARQRAGEERVAAEALARAGVPILQSPRGNATFEGADALWLDSETVLIGVGRRTNAEGFAQLAKVLKSMGVRTLSFPLPAGIQHLLGIMNLLDTDLVAIDAVRAPASLRRLLGRHGLSVLELSPEDEVANRKALNLVTLAPREVVMPANCPGAKARLEAAGVTCHELDVSEYIKAAGALGCLTGILRRGD